MKTIFKYLRRLTTKERILYTIVVKFKEKALTYYINTYSIEESEKQLKELLWEHPNGQVIDKHSKITRVPIIHPVLFFLLCLLLIILL